MFALDDIEYLPTILPTGFVSNVKQLINYQWLITAGRELKTV